MLLDPDVDDILHSLDLILSHASFKSSPQLSAFLFYVVIEEIAGRGELIKAYSVAVDALGRPESFDPAENTVIRVVATRLRKALADFYQEAVGVPVRISLVRGSYRPQFAPNPPLPVSAADIPTDAAEPAPALSRQQVERYRLIISVLLVLLSLAIGFIVWQLENHTLETAHQAANPPHGIATTSPAKASIRPLSIGSGVS